ncbi:MAG: peptidoglycan-binding protein [Alphaproteobacteria bacterium]|nr:peptidoglycan-binding protein [Alphaproteobacteria bacterium]
MTLSFSYRSLIVSLFILSLALGAPMGQAVADEPYKPVVKAHTYKKHTRVSHVKKSVAKAAIRKAQEQLARLGYYLGKIDGIMGPQTRKAIKEFQRDYGLVVDGILGPKTIAALNEADRRTVPVPVPKKHLVPLSTDGIRELPNRFARVEVSSYGGGGDKSYVVTLNGETLLSVGGQPAGISISPTYEIGDEDAIIFTMFCTNDSVCPYRSRVLVLDARGSKLLSLDSCSLRYKADVNEGSLYINFFEENNANSLGQMWRLDGMTLTRL